MKILVTGGAGFIGSNFVRMHLNSQLNGVDEIIVLDSLTYAGTLTNFSQSELNQFDFVHGDINDAEVVNGLMKRVDAVVHFAAESHVDRSIQGSSDFIKTNVLGTHNLLECARRNDVNNFVHVSTDEVYGSLEVGSWDEEEPLLPNSPYAASKASSDLIVRSFNKTFSMNTRTTRCSNNYGSHQFPEKVIPLFVTNLIEGKKIPLYGDGLNVRDWLHVDDHCRGINLVLLGGRSGEIYNIGGGRELTNKELTYAILENLNQSEEMIEKVADRLGHDKRYSVDYSKISRELGYEPQVQFENGIKSTIEWYKENEAWWKPLKNTVVK
jgi:dTDP-glucose 4,6-dehydratase